MSSQKVFISSVMRDYELPRTAAKRAVELLGHRAVMADDFFSKPYSSQRACLEGVEQCGLVVLILGARYGWIAESGKAATEEEYDHARKLGIPILIFLEDIDREPKQNEFVHRVSSYETGFHRTTFSSPDSLKDQVIGAINELIKGAAEKDLNPTAAKSLFDQIKWGGRKERSSETWLGGVITPSRPAQYVSPITLGKTEFHRAIQKEAVYGDNSIFESEHGVSVSETEVSASFTQSNGSRKITSLEIGTDGTIVFGKLLSATRRRIGSIVENFVIDEGEVNLSLAKQFRFANVVYGLFADSRVLTAFYFGGSLSGLEFKMFGRIPEIPANGMSMGLQNSSDPLYFPREPYAISRARLADGRESAAEVTELIARMFRANRAYYTPENSRF